MCKNSGMKVSYSFKVFKKVATTDIFLLYWREITEGGELEIGI